MRAIIVTGKLVQDHEFIYPYYRLQEEEYIVDIATKDKETVLGYFGTTIIPTKSISELKVEDYDLLVLPGGVKAMEHIRQNMEVINFVSDFHYAGKVIACICSATQLLISAKVVNGKRISGYYAMKDDITNAGAIYVDEPAVVDSKIITSPHYKHLGAWMKAVFEVMQCK